ncbi:TRAG family protein [Zhengella mangrovi]|uniref:TRAG family protein n=1 Tax=Zhengella mangrovi TaxID=1982044 RepID=A0A2G1QHM7_9HYPH|nr:type IV secretory system conjugative DNA transfer family protein [Zhengella mangrovi]PHP64970.1 TRAG family protein [Zhengella mangrovi]
MGVFDDIPRGVSERRGREQRLEDQAMPSAGFMPLAPLRNPRSLSFEPGKILLGASEAEIEVRRLPSDEIDAHALGGNLIGAGDDRHCVTTAGTRGGKGRSVIVPTLLSYAGSVVVFDPKGELASITARYRAETLGQDVHVLDPFGVTTGPAARMRSRYNFLAPLSPDNPSLIEDTGLLSDGCVVPAEGGKDPHWDESARNIIEGLIQHVVTFDGYRERRSLATVRDLLAFRDEVIATGGSAKPVNRLRAEMEANDALDGIVADAAEDFFSKPDDERGSVLSTARRHLKFLSYPAIRENVSGHDLDLADIKRKPTTVYLCLPAMRMGTCNRWVRLFINQTLAAFERERRRPPIPVLMILDEFAVLGHMKTVEDAAGQVAGFGVRLWPIIQDLGQLKTLYRDRWQSFMANAGVLQFFANNDVTTLEWISKRLGTTSLIVANQSEVGDQDRTSTGRMGQNWSLQTRELMTLEEVGRFFARDDPEQRQLVLIAGKDPIICQRIKYDSHAYFRGRFDASDL